MAVIKKEPSPFDTWEFGNETINLISDDEGNDDTAMAGSAFDKVRSIQRTDADPTVEASVLGEKKKIQEAALKRQHQLAQKFRARQPISDNVAGVDSNSNNDDTNQRSSTSGTPGKHKKDVSGNDAAALEFEKIKERYLKKKLANTLSVAEEIEILQHESNESARLRKKEADEEYCRAEATSQHEDEALFMSDQEQEPNTYRPYAAQPSKKRTHKSTTAEDGDAEQHPKRTKPNTSTKKSKITTTTMYTDSDDEDIYSQSQIQPAAKGRKKTKPKPKGKKSDKHNMVQSIFSADIFADTAKTAHLADQPTFVKKGVRGQRNDALKQLIASVPTGDRKEAGDDTRLLKKCIKSFTGGDHGSVVPAGDSNWKIRGMRTTLKHYQILGVGFMRDRENSSSEPKGGILADMMGLGKTLMALGNIVNGLPDKSKKHRTTLIVAGPAILTQWYNEIKRHCFIDKTDKHGLGSIMQYSSGHKPLCSNVAQMFLENDVVLSTYHEVLFSYPSAEPPKEITDPAEKDAWSKQNFADNKGPLHAVRWHRVILDEGHQIKNHRSRTSNACRSLNARHKWVLTGTPAINTPLEFYPYFDFIHEKAAGDYELFKKNFGDTPKGRQRLAVLLQKTMCRRTHLTRMFGAKLLDIPMPSERTHWVQMNEIERKIYKIVETRFIKRINRMSRDGELDKKYKHIWTMLLRLRQLCSHILLIEDSILELLEREDFEELRDMTNNEADLSAEGVSLLCSLRKILETRRPTNNEGDHELGQNIIETESKPIDLIDFDEIDDQHGRMHGMSFHFRKYLDTVPGSRQWEQLLERSTCCACGQPPDDPHVVISCYHIYCYSCLRDWQQRAARRGKDCADCAECGEQFTSANRCIEIENPQARKSTTANTTLSPDTEEANAQKKLKKKSWIDMDGEILPSAKTIAVKAQVLEWLSENPKAKIVVYTQWLPMLKVLGKVCAAERWGYNTYSGEMSYDARNRAVEEFGKDDSKNILLASLKCGGLGLNLTMATCCINIEPYWNSAIEQQAFCRIFRIGQRHPTQIVRLVVKGTVEARMQEIKQQKQIEIDDVLETHQKQDKLSMHDLLRLFSDVDDDDEAPFIHPKGDSRFFEEEE